MKNIKEYIEEVKDHNKLCYELILDLEKNKDSIDAGVFEAKIDFLKSNISLNNNDIIKYQEKMRNYND